MMFELFFLHRLIHQMIYCVRLSTYLLVQDCIPLVVGLHHLVNQLDNRQYQSLQSLYFRSIFSSWVSPL